MGYDSKHIAVKTAKEGYNLIAEEYNSYHTHLDGFDNGMVARFLPKEKGLSIIDLGAGDGRTRKLFKNMSPKYYVACDIAEEMLKKHPCVAPIEKVICDLEEILPFENKEFDYATSFFVLEHIADLDTLFGEVQRILSPGGKRIIGHFLQRREFLRKKGKEEFKIQFYNHRIQDLEQLAKEHFFSTDTFPISEKGIII